MIQKVLIRALSQVRQSNPELKMQMAGLSRQLFFLIVAMLFSMQSYAACYTPEQARAEQIIRIHSELMVIGLNCQHRTELGNAYSVYQNFTARFSPLIRQSEADLEYYYRQNGADNPARAVHDLRTAIANKISKDAAYRPDGFCANYGPRLSFASAVSHPQLQQWAGKYPVSSPLCGQY